MLLWDWLKSGGIAYHRYILTFSPSISASFSNMSNPVLDVWVKGGTGEREGGREGGGEGLRTSKHVLKV